jgi:hypothetical protein
VIALVAALALPADWTPAMGLYARLTVSSHIAVTLFA